MATQILSITDRGDQAIRLLTDSGDVDIRLRYQTATQSWTMDVEYGDLAVYGVRLAVNCDLIRGANMPFTFWVEDASGNGLDPYSLTDFSRQRCKLYFVPASELTAVRGVEVPADG